MPITCKFITIKQVRYERPTPAPLGAWKRPEWVDAATGKRPVPGDMFFNEDYLRHWRDHLAPHYFAHNAHRPPVTVVLPDGTWFLVDGRTSEDGTLGSDGWNVTGEPPRLTILPSINCLGLYHGYLTDGVLSNDVEGRVFP